jgi:hypothetical protein
MRYFVLVLMMCFLTYITASDVLTLTACMKRHINVEPNLRDEIFIPYDDPVMDAVFGGSLTSTCECTPDYTTMLFDSINVSGGYKCECSKTITSYSGDKWIHYYTI